MKKLQQQVKINEKFMSVNTTFIIAIAILLFIPSNAFADVLNTVYDHVYHEILYYSQPTKSCSYSGYHKDFWKDANCYEYQQVRNDSYRAMDKVLNEYRNQLK